MKKFKELMKNKLFRYLFIAGLVVVFTLIDNELAELGILDIPTSTITEETTSAPEATPVSETLPTEAPTPEVVVTATPEATEAPSTPTPTTIAPTSEPAITAAPSAEITSKKITLADIPAYTGKAYVIINNNEPFFTREEMTSSSYEFYSDLDSLGRCGMCIASVGVDIMPTEDRGEIGNVKPTGWVQEKYSGLVDGNYLYNRCHLIGYQLTGENANVKNLITGTRSFNVDAMLPFENMVADYVQETKNHVMYRVTPMFDGDNLVATGVLMEAKSVEDDGEDLLFCVFCYNVQPGVAINYATGKNWLDNSTPSTTESTPAPTATPTPSPEPTLEPTPEPEITPTNNQSSTTYVWKSATGSKYHSINDCGNMNPNKAVQITLEEAEALNLGRCSKCY